MENRSFSLGGLRLWQKYVAELQSLLIIMSECAFSKSLLLKHLRDFHPLKNFVIFFSSLWERENTWRHIVSAAKTSSAKCCEPTRLRYEPLSLFEVPAHWVFMTECISRANNSLKIDLQCVSKSCFQTEAYLANAFSIKFLVQ